MKLLVVEGNPKTLWQERASMGSVPYHRRFIQMLHVLGYEAVDVAFPVEQEHLPDTQDLQRYAGILLTGSALNIYDTAPEVTRQLDFAAHCFAAGVPIYGSCWGLQIAVTVAGGRIGKSKNGREFGISKAIQLTDAGKKSPFFANKPAVFDAYCIHEDDTHELPDNTTILASNLHSEVQALSINYKKSAFFGVQYHPEFTYDDIRFLCDWMETRFITEGIYSTQKSKTDYINEILNHPTVNDYDFHVLEVANWLKCLYNNDIQAKH